MTGEKVNDLDSFLRIVSQVDKKRSDDESAFVRLTTIDLSGREKVCTLQPDPVYWPSMDLRRNPETDEWTLSSH